MSMDEFGNKHWFNENGELHREDGPAVENINGRKEYHINGQLHREDGPAIEWVIIYFWINKFFPVV